MESACQVMVQGDMHEFLEIKERLKVPEHMHEPSRIGEKTQKDDLDHGTTSALATDSIVSPVTPTPPPALAPASPSGDTAEQLSPLDADQGQRRTDAQVDDNGCTAGPGRFASRCERSCSSG